MARRFFTNWPHPAPFAYLLPAQRRPRSAAATLIYELKLHHYVLHLQRSGTLTHFMHSAVAVHSTVRPTPCEAFPSGAGEDFYLLNKLAKVGPVTLPEAAG